ncbi:AAA domain-containing protein [Paraliobacillus sediminis]|uniref:AAA domain-containing protein n=1 Tax=Paraliobacillus sediminis TaxID=1885916 RepID=UPI000E3CA60B|nr:AAA domain-containing protein [Paraliobacillus sediminis]
MKEKMLYLKDKLNDLSRRNRSIRMLKKYDKWSFDISTITKIDQDPQTILDAIITKKTKIDLVKQSVNNEESLALTGKLTSLYRNLKSIEEETGIYDLYIGYPFISGSMLDGTYIRAPLFLYPVKLERVKTHGMKWTLEPVDSVEPMLNRSVFLAMQKMSDLYVPDEMYEDAEKKATEINFSDWLTWLKGYALNIAWSESTEIESFQDYKVDTIPSFEKGAFQLDNHAIIGHFPQGSSALLKDYEDFIQLAEEDNAGLGIVEDLINIEASAYSYQSDNLPGKPLDKTKTKKAEKEKFFVLDTDASQEEIIEKLEETKGLVIHGPPGTGKSQVIVNVIANAISENKKILLVCQKRAALDVVYQRLDGLGLSSTISLLHDEQKDRKSLYKKINTRLTLDTYSDEIETKFEQISEKIRKIEAELDVIAKGLYEVQPHGFRAFDLYGLGKPLTKQEVSLNLRDVLKALNKENFDEVLATIFSYGSNYERFGKESYPLTDRKSFSNLGIHDRQTIVEVLHKAMEQARKSSAFLDHFEQENITPEYSWEIGDKLDKIYEDLNPSEKKTLQKLRLWWWTSVTGKTIVEELLEGDKFKGLSSTEWPKLRESLRVLYDLSAISEEMSTGVDALSPYFSNEKIARYKDQIAKGDIPLSELEKQHEYVIQDFEDLRNMDRIYDDSLPFVQSIINKLKDKDLEKHNELNKQWVDIARQSTYMHWLDEIETKHRSLLKVGTEEFERLRTDFKELLAEKQVLSAKVLQNRLLHTLSEVRDNNAKAIKDIIHQTGKKRQVWPVRKLVQKYSLNGLLDVMPVWLVSPETASAIFPLEKDLFDIVIFDEASQCTVENGIPAIYRGSKVIVAGDEMQLPPSTLFKGVVQVDEDDEDNELEESESLLNLSKRVFPSRMLQWHYRSKSEELINFSNHAFYNGNIQIAPNVDHLQDPSAIQWHKVDGRWINQCNEIEAKEVVSLLKKQLIKAPNKTVGIITFNAKQQDKINDYIDALSETDEEFNAVYQQIMSKDLDERVFVKNIENVQGDERDTIIFSIGYARNAEGRVYNRFGTLGQQGGENRLNVAVTRAKEQIHLFSSIEPHELNVSNTKNDGPRFLKSYMEYAQAVSKLERETAEAVLATLNADMNTKRKDHDLTFDSPFETEVYDHLTQAGYKVDTQVGMSGYRIDLAIVHPKYPEKYIIGIECDGAMYHSAPSAKERDVYRQRFLESKGWKINRIWSRNWWKDPVTEIEKIDQVIKQMVEKEEAKEEMRND